MAHTDHSSELTNSRSYQLHLLAVKIAGLCGLLPMAIYFAWLLLSAIEATFNAIGPRSEHVIDLQFLYVWSFGPRVHISALVFVVCAIAGHIALAHRLKVRRWVTRHG
jgi:hypothetical protein